MTDLSDSEDEAEDYDGELVVEPQVLARLRSQSSTWMDNVSRPSSSLPVVLYMPAIPSTAPYVIEEVQDELEEDLKHTQYSNVIDEPMDLD